MFAGSILFVRGSGLQPEFQLVWVLESKNSSRRDRK